MLNCLPGLTSDSITNGTPGSGSTDSAGSTGSFSDGSVTKCMNAMQIRNELNNKNKS